MEPKPDALRVDEARAHDHPASSPDACADLTNGALASAKATPDEVLAEAYETFLSTFVAVAAALEADLVASIAAAKRQTEGGAW